MKIRTTWMLLVALFVGAIAGAAARRVDPNLYRSKSKEDAARALLDLAKQQAGKGSWERLGVARIYYLGGMKPEGEAIIEPILKKEADSSDIFRIGRIYQEAGEWEKATEMFARYLKEEPNDDKALAEVGAYYMLHGDREKAEELFERSFRAESEVWATVNMAGSYLGIPPQP